MNKTSFSITGGPSFGLTFLRRQRHCRFALNRNGSVVPLIAFLLPVFCVFIALAVDFGVISLGKHQLQNAADAGAVAAIETYFKNLESSDEAANEVITHSQLLGSSIEFNIGQSIEYGSWDSTADTFTVISRKGSAGAQDISGTSIPEGANAARVTLTRSPENGNAVGLFFGPIFGQDFASVSAFSIASASAG